MSFWEMGGYAAFIWPAYAVSALGLIAAAAWTLLAYGAAKKRLKELESGK
jgi:heme exporter protein CcmD